MTENRIIDPQACPMGNGPAPRDVGTHEGGAVTMLTANGTLLTDPRRLRSVNVNDAGHVVGQDHHRARLTDHDVDLIRDLKVEGLTYRQISRKFDVSRSTVESICLLRRRSALVVAQKATARA